MGRRTGNWTDDLGQAVGFMLKVALYGVPVLILVIVVLSILLVVKW